MENIMKSNADGDDVQAYDISGWDTTYWMKVADENGTLLHETKLGLEGDGYYVANTGNTVNLEDTTPEGEYIQLGNPIFQTVTMNPDVAEVTEDLGTEIGEITVKACAVQYSEDQMDSWKDAFDSAKELKIRSTGGRPMKRNKVAKLMVVAALVGAIGIGGSLALLTARSEAVTNTFTVGKGLHDTDITLDEAQVNENGEEIDRAERVQKNTYQNLEQGDGLDKDPTVTIKDTAADCYVFVLVDGLKRIHPFTTWI